MLYLFIWVNYSDSYYWEGIRYKGAYFSFISVIFLNKWWYSSGIPSIGLVSWGSASKDEICSICLICYSSALWLSGHTLLSAISIWLIYYLKGYSLLFLEWLSFTLSFDNFLICFLSPFVFYYTALVTISFEMQG